MISKMSPRAILHAPAVAVGAQVDLGRQELREDIAVRAVHLDAVESGGLGTFGGGDEVVTQLLDFGSA